MGPRGNTPAVLPPAGPTALPTANLTGAVASGRAHRPVCERARGGGEGGGHLGMESSGPAPPGRRCHGGMQGMTGDTVKPCLAYGGAVGVGLLLLSDRGARGRDASEGGRYPPPPPRCIWMPLVNGPGNSPSPGRPTPGVVKQDKSSGGSVDTTKTRSDPQRVRLSSGERPIGAAKGKQPDTEALCPPPPPPPSLCPATVPLTPSAGLNGICNRQ